MNKTFDPSAKARRQTGTNRRRISIEPLEERILLSVDLVPYAPDNRDEIDAFYEREIEPVRTAVEQTEQSAEDAAARELVLLDESLGDLSSLTSALSEIGFGVLDRKELAVVGAREDIVAALSSGVRYDAIHWISHGSAEGLQLGTELLSGDVAADDPVVTALTRALGPDSDLMLYGCDLAAGELPHRLAVLTGADVAASIDVTGAEGDWDLEVDFGQIETAALDLGDAVAALSTADTLTNVLSGVAVANDMPFADLFAASGQFDGLHVPEAEAWETLGGGVDPLTDLGATGAEAVENAVAWLEEAMRAAGEAALRSEIKALPQSERDALFALTSIDVAYDAAEPTHIDAIIDVLADGLYLSNAYGLTLTDSEIAALRPIVTETDETQLSDLLDALASANPSLVQEILNTSNGSPTYDSSDDTHRVYVLSVIRDAAFFESAVSTATLNRLMAAYSAGAETISFGADTGAQDSALVTELKGNLSGTLQTTADLAIKRLLSLFSGMKTTLELSSGQATLNALTHELVLDGSFEDLPEALSQGFETARGQIALTKVFDATGVGQTAETELELRTVTELSHTLAAGAVTTLQLSNVPNVVVPAHVRLGDLSFDLSLDAKGKSLAAALEEALEAATGFPSDLTMTVSRNTVSFDNTNGASRDFALFLNKTGVRSANLTDGTEQTVTFAEAATRRATP